MFRGCEEPGTIRVDVLETACAVKSAIIHVLVIEDNPDDADLVRIMLEKARDPAFYDAKGRIISGNDKFLAMIGADHEEYATGRLRRWGQLVPPQWKRRMRQASEEFRTTGRVTPYETEYIGRDRSKFWGLFGATKLDGKPEGIPSSWTSPTAKDSRRRSRI